MKNIPQLRTEIQNLSNKDISEFNLHGKHLDAIDLMASKIRYITFLKKDREQTELFINSFLKYNKYILLLVSIVFLTIFSFSINEITLLDIILPFSSAYALLSFLSIPVINTNTGGTPHSASPFNAVASIMLNKGVNSKFYLDDVITAKSILGVN